MKHPSLPLSLPYSVWVGGCMSPTLPAMSAGLPLRDVCTMITPQVLSKMILAGEAVGALSLTPRLGAINKDDVMR